MTDDGDDPATITLVGVGVSTALGLATTGLALSKGKPDYPDVAPPLPPPAPPPPPAALPPPPTDTQAQEGVATQRRKQAQRFSVSDTLLTSPLGGAGVRTPGKSILGG